MLGRWLTVCLCVLIAAIAGAQGGQGGFGGGGFGGAGGGFQGGGSEAGGGQTEQRSLFLSPGDRTEWTFEAKENDTIIVRITSSIFDPAVAIHDESGKKLVENDDIEPGNQMAQLMYAVPKAGTYKAVVTNYKGTAGGQFELFARRFTSTPLKMGEIRRLETPTRQPWARIAIDKRGDYAITVRGAQSQGMSILKPNGESIDTRTVDSRDDFQRQRIFVTEPGVYFINLFGAGTPEVRVAPVVIKEIALGGTAQANLAADEVYDWRIQTKADDLFEVSLVGSPEDLVIEAVTITSTQGRRLYTVLENPHPLPRYVVAVINDARLAFSVRHATGAPAAFQIRAIRTGKTWPGSGAITSKLDWNQREFWTFDAKPGDVIRLRGISPTYRVFLSTMVPSGDVVGSSSIGRTPEVGTTLTARTAGRYVVSVSGGGIGEYRLSREVIEPKRFPRDGANGTVSADAPEIWRVTSRKGQDVALKIDGEGLQWQVTVLDPAGGTMSTLNGDSDLLRLKFPADGEYTIIVNARNNKPTPYRLRWIDLG